MVEASVAGLDKPVSISAALRAAAQVIDHLLDRAVARVTGASVVDIPREVIANARTFGAGADPATEDERLAAARVAGVSDRPIEALETAPGLPQSLIASRQSRAARAAALTPDPIWQLAAMRASSSEAGRARAEALDAWLRATILLTEGRVTLEPHAPRTLWTLVHGEATTDASLTELAQTAARFACTADAISFVESYLCLEHGLRLGLPPDTLDTIHPLTTLDPAGAPRYGFSSDPPAMDEVPPDFRPYLFSVPPQGFN